MFPLTTHIRPRRLAIGAAAAVVTLAAGGCSSGLSEASTCSEFLAADPTEQHQVVQQLAGKYQKPDYATPLGMPAVPYYCANHPDTTLDEFFSAAG